MNPDAGIVFAAILGVIPGMIAQRKGRCFVDWWLYGTALFAVALVHSVLLRPYSTRCIYKGVFLLATGRAEGLDYFGGTPARFLASLASLGLWPLIAVGALASGHGGPEMLSDVMASVCAVLAPPVITHELATRWDRAAQWPRYATAFNWCQWALPVAGLIVVTIVAGLSRSGMLGPPALVVLIGMFGVYGFWLHWFVARRGLALSPLRAAVLVVAVNAAVVLLVLLPRLLIKGAV